MASRVGLFLGSEVTAITWAHSSLIIRVGLVAGLRDRPSFGCARRVAIEISLAGLGARVVFLFFANRGLAPGG